MCHLCLSIHLSPYLPLCPNHVRTRKFPNVVLPSAPVCYLPPFYLASCPYYLEGLKVYLYLYIVHFTCLMYLALCSNSSKDPKIFLHTSSLPVHFPLRTHLFPTFPIYVLFFTSELAYLLSVQPSCSFSPQNLHVLHLSTLPVLFHRLSYLDAKPTCLPSFISLSHTFSHHFFPSFLNKLFGAASCPSIDRYIKRENKKEKII